MMFETIALYGSELTGRISYKIKKALIFNI